MLHPLFYLPKWMSAEKLQAFLRALLTLVRECAQSAEKWSKLTFPPGDVVDAPRASWYASLPAGADASCIESFEESEDGGAYSSIAVRPAVSLYDFFTAYEPVFYAAADESYPIVYVRGLEVVEKECLVADGEAAPPTAMIEDSPVWWLDDGEWVAAERTSSGARIPQPDGTSVRIRYFESARRAWHYRVEVSGVPVQLSRLDLRTPLDDVAEPLVVKRAFDESNQAFQARVELMRRFGRASNLDAVAFRVAGAMGLVEEQTVASGGEYALPSGAYHAVVPELPSLSLRSEELQPNADGCKFAGRTMFWENYIVFVGGRPADPGQFSYDGVDTITFAGKVSDVVTALSWRRRWRLVDGMVTVGLSIAHPTVTIQTPGSVHVWACDLTNWYDHGLVDAAGRPTQLLSDIVDVAASSNPVCIGRAVWGVRWPEFLWEAPAAELAPLVWDSE